jgi:hypothetical protein
MNNNSTTSEVAGAICLLFETYFIDFGDAFTAEEALNLSNSSFRPAYSDLYEAFGDLALGDAMDIHSALRENRISDAKDLVSRYGTQVESSISSLTEAGKAVYDDFLYFLTVELPNPAPPNGSYYSDPRIPVLDYNSPGAALAFAHLAVVMMEYIIGQL